MNEEEIKKEWFKNSDRLLLANNPGYTKTLVAEWWLDKMKDLREKTIEEAKKCVPIELDGGNSDLGEMCEATGFNDCRQQTLTNLEQLKGLDTENR